MQCFGNVLEKPSASMFLTMFFKTQNIVQTMHLTMPTPSRGAGQTMAKFNCFLSFSGRHIKAGIKIFGYSIYSFSSWQRNIWDWDTPVKHYYVTQKPVQACYIAVYVRFFNFAFSRSHDLIVGDDCDDSSTTGSTYKKAEWSVNFGFASDPMYFHPNTEKRKWEILLVKDKEIQGDFFHWYLPKKVWKT